MRIKCDESMRRSKFRKRRGREGRACNKDCKRCICGMVQLNDGTYEHIKLDKNGEMIKTQRMGETDDK